MEYLYKIRKDGKALSVPQSESDYTEDEIETLLQNNPLLVMGKPLLFIGRQVSTSSSKRMDLLAIDKSARLVVIELKRGVAPRDIIAQVLDYSSWLSQLPEREIEKIAKEYFQKTESKHATLSEAYKEFSGRELEKQVGGEIVSVLFARQFTEGVTQPVSYLNENGLSIVCIQFEMYQKPDEERYLYSRLVSGELDEEADSENQRPVSEKIKIRSVLKKVSDYLEETIGSWSSSLTSEKVHPFKVYQSKDGAWSSTYIDWVMEDGSKLALDFGIDMNEQSPRFCTFIHVRRKSEYFSELIENRKNLSGYFEEFEDEGETEGKPELAKYTDVSEINYESIEKLVKNEFKILKPILEEILGVSE